MIYNVRTRQLHAHSIYVEMYEWLLWTGVITFGADPSTGCSGSTSSSSSSTIVTGLAVLVWIRFMRFPPYFAAYERQLAKQRYFSRQRFTRTRDDDPDEASRRRRRR